MGPLISNETDRNGQENNERKNNDKIKSVCAGFSKHSNSQRMNTDDALLLALLVLKKREIAKNAAALRKHKVWVRELLTER